MLHTVTRSILVTIATALVVSAALAQPPGPPRGGRRHGPPPIAIEACANAVEDDACAFVGRYGERIAGSCVKFGEQLACKPDDMPPPPPDDRGRGTEDE